MSRPKLSDSIGLFHDAAKAKTGLSDFGDSNYLEGLNILLSASDAESDLNDAMYQFTCEQVISALCGRLFETIGDVPPAEFEMAYYRQHEESAMVA